jgi:hypothetical protein
MIQSDQTIADLLSRVTNLTTFDFVYFAIEAGGDTNFFPCLSGEPESYYPFQFKVSEAKLINEQLGLRTFNEMYVDFKFQPDRDVQMWILQLNACLEKPMTLHMITGIFKNARV